MTFVQTRVDAMSPATPVAIYVDPFWVGLLAGLALGAIGATIFFLISHH